VKETILNMARDRFVKRHVPGTSTGSGEAEEKEVANEKRALRDLGISDKIEE
jgi:hypothetical protein